MKIRISSNDLHALLAGLLIVAIAALLSCPLPAKADVGFVIPNGASSNCGPPRCAAYRAIDKSKPALPPQESTRYGDKNPSWDHDNPGVPWEADITRGNNLHETDFVGELNFICINEPDYFARNNLGNAAGTDCHPTIQEASDAYFTQDGAGGLIRAENCRLAGQMAGRDVCAPPAPNDVCGRCGDGAIQAGENCEHCPWDHRSGECASPASVPTICPVPPGRQPWPATGTPPPPPPPPGGQQCDAPRVCIDPPAACPVCAPPSAPLAQCDVLALQTVPQSVRDDCARAKAYPLGTGQTATIRRICALVAQVKQFLPGTDSNASLRVVKVNGASQVVP